MDLLNLVNEHRYEDLFVDELFWDSGDYREPLQISLEKEDCETGTFTLENVANAENIRVFVCDQLPSRTVQAKIAAKVAQKSTHYFVIFHDGAAQQAWRWPAQVLRGDRASVKLTSHEHTRGLLNPKLVKRLEAIRLIPGEKLSVTQMYDKIQAAFDTETADETKKASQLMVNLFESLEEAGLSENHISETLARILFVMFGDDTEMWGAGNDNLFERFVEEHTAEDGSDFAERLNNLFVFLDTKPRKDYELAAEGGPAELKGFRYVNGGIFSNPQPLPASVGAKFREAVLRACRTDWADISPAIFGSMFQSVRDAATRRAMGEHYTSEKDILKTLNPLFLDDLRGIFHNARGKSDEPKRLRDLRQRISHIKFMDPACGCGNFVIIAYRELRALELAIVARLVELREISGLEAGFALDVARPQTQAEKASSLEPMVVIDNFYGIEIDPWPAAIARTAMFLIERQSDQLMNEKFGYAPARLPIRQESHIVTADSIEVDWNKIIPCGASDEIIIAGNPPFIGYNDRSELQLEQISKMLDGEKPGRLDFVGLWYIKSVKFFDHKPKGWFAYVSTSSITQGEPVGLLFNRLLINDWKISFAYQPFKWSVGELKGDKEASVHCVIIGMQKNFRGKPKLFKNSARDGQSSYVDNINAYLVDAPSVIVKKASSGPICSGIPELKNGSVAGDTVKRKESPLKGLPGLIMGFEEGQSVIERYPELKPYIKIFVGGQDILNGKYRYCFWFEQEPPYFVVDHPEVSLRLKNVEKVRLASTEKSTQLLARTPWKFKFIAQPTQKYICIPRTGSMDREYIPAIYLTEDIVVSNGSFWGEDSDGFIFSIVSSSMMMAWQDAIGGRLNGDPRFANTLVWNTFPLPDIKESLREQIIVSGQEVLRAREKANQMSGLTLNLNKLYKPQQMPLELKEAHKALDVLVDQAFGATTPLTSDEERLQLLFNQYVSLTAVEEKAKATAPAKKTRTRTSR